MHTKVHSSFSSRLQKFYHQVKACFEGTQQYFVAMIPENFSINLQNLSKSLDVLIDK